MQLPCRSFSSHKTCLLGFFFRRQIPPSAPRYTLTQVPMRASHHHRPILGRWRSVHSSWGAFVVRRILLRRAWKRSTVAKRMPELSRTWSVFLFPSGSLWKWGKRHTHRHRHTLKRWQTAAGRAPPAKGADATRTPPRSRRAYAIRNLESWIDIRRSAYKWFISTLFG